MDGVRTRLRDKQKRAFHAKMALEDAIHADASIAFRDTDFDPTILVLEDDLHDIWLAPDVQEQDWTQNLHGRSILDDEENWVYDFQA